MCESSHKDLYVRFILQRRVASFFPRCNSLSERKSRTEQKWSSQRINQAARGWQPRSAISCQSNFSQKLSQFSSAPFLITWTRFPRRDINARERKRSRRKRNKKLREEETRCLKQTVPPILFFSHSFFFCTASYLLISRFSTG